MTKNNKPAPHGRSLYRLVRWVLFFFTPVYHVKYTERHKEMYGMTPLEKVRNELDQEAKKKKNKAN